MKVVLPDNSELELADGATGLDAARAIGAKLAEQAVLVRADGEVQDLRLPLADGRQIRFLTTRDRDDPDALYAEFVAKDVPMHSALANTRDGLRAFEIKDNNGYVLCFGRPMDRGTEAT